jgi:hypothetical protein
MHVCSFFITEGGNNTAQRYLIIFDSFLLFTIGDLQRSFIKYQRKNRV